MVRKKRFQKDDKGGFLTLKRKADFSFKGFKTEELKNLSLNDFKKLVPSRQRRSLTRGPNEQQKKLLDNVKRTKRAEVEGEKQKLIKTHIRDLVITPDLIGYTISVHNGKIFIPVTIRAQMIGHFLGEFSMTRKPINHGAPGIGASKSSTAISGQKK